MGGASANVRKSLLIALSLLTELPAWAGSPPRLVHRASDEQSEITFLLGKATAGSLATASLLARLIVPSSDRDSSGMDSSDPSVLIDKAVQLAPDRPELIWLQLRDCELRRCPEEAQIAGRMQALDPANGFAWLSDIRAPSLSSPEITQVLLRMSAAPTTRLYWNKRAVMMFEALTHTGRSPPATAITHDADDRLTHVTSVLAALDVPALQLLTRACRTEAFDSPGRRAACTSLMSRMESSDSVIAQGIGVLVQLDWWPAGSPEHETLLRKRLQQRYQTIASNRARQGRADGDAKKRVEAMRHLQGEDEVERAMLTYFQEPLERPPEWQSPGGGE